MHALKPKFIPAPLVCAIALILSACGGGSFNNPNTITVGHSQLIPTNPSTTPANPPPPPTKSDDPLIAPTIGSVMPIVKRNTLYEFESGKYIEEHAPINDKALTNAHQSTLDELSATLSKTYKNTRIHQSDNRAYQFVKAGWIFADLYSGDTEVKKEGTKVVGEYTKGAGYLYYQGNNPATAHTKGKATYTGHWDYMTDAKRVRDKDSGGHGRGGGTHYGMDGSFGDELSATSFAEQVFGQYAPRQGNHQAVFEVDFDAKSLTGTLSSKQQKAKNDNPTSIDRYGITANIVGNRFVGTATAKNTNSEYNLFSKHATNRLEGGFFGENAEELAGKFLSDDNSLFGVFAGKQNGTPTQFDKRYDGQFVEVTQDSDVNKSQTAQVLPFANFGHVNQLYVNGKLIELLPLSNKQTDRQNVTLPNGQTAVITSFGTADGLLRLGSITKTAIAPTMPSEADIAEAKSKLAKLADDQESQVDALLTNFIESEEDDKTVMMTQILQATLAGYSEGATKDKAKTNAERYLKQLEQNPEHETAFENLLALVKKGDKYNPKVDANWQALLPNAKPANTLLNVDSSLHGLYLLGERTPSDSMPKGGEMTYKGTWHGRIGQYYQSEAGYGEFDGKSEFLADFGKKRLSGTLTEKSGVSPAFMIDATISGNGFAGTATSRLDGINLDKGQQQNQQILPQTVATNLTGGFYGDNAKHLAGAFSFDSKLEGKDTSVVGGAVFYGSQTAGDKP